MNRSEYIPILVELFNGSCMRRAVANLEHGTLCRAFSLDPASTWFDVPSTFYGVGSSMGMQSTGPRRDISGYIFQGPKGSDPIGKIRITYEGDRFGNRHDDDPFDKRAFYDLNR